MQMDESVNVFGEPLEPCGMDPATGFFRDGCCNTSEIDHGCHTVCVAVTDEFLNFTRSQGNDLSTPVPAFGFPGLKPGDSWCLCASRWLEAHEEGKAPRVFLRRSHKKTLETVAMEILRSYAVDLS
jgi:uncharacterized protein (DUF2237 family)